MTPRPPAHAEPISDLLARLGVDLRTGLSLEAVTARLAKDGRNELPPPPRPSAWKRFVTQFANPIVLTLLAAAVIALVDGASREGQPLLARYGDATAIFLIVILNAALGYYQEARAESALDALQKMQTPSARTRRGGKVETTSAAELVAGDVILLEAGDAIPADARLTETFELHIEEASLTGESVPSSKNAMETPTTEAGLGDRCNCVYLGTNVVRGRGVAVVHATGVRTELGKLSKLLHETGDRKTPLEDKLERFGKQILWGCLALSTLLFVRGMLKGDHRTWHELLLEAVSLAVAAIPEGLPAITTITLALGMQRMARRGALVRKLAAVETLGAATVICSDKTGTLTQNEMTVREVVCFGRRFDVTGTGYDPQGEVLEGGKPLDDAGALLAPLLETAALCNNAHLQKTEEGRFKVVGDPTEGALLTLASKCQGARKTMLEAIEIAHELPFDSDRKRMSVVVRRRDMGTGASLYEVLSKGSADVLLAHCTHIAIEDREPAPLDDEVRKRVLAHTERMSAASLRVLGFARRVAGAEDPGTDPATLEAGLTFVGLVGMIDPPRVGVKEAVKACADARVRAVMITGDHKLTAVAIAKELGLWEEAATAVTGGELDAMTDAGLAARIDTVRVFARVTAEQKLRIVRAFKAAGHVVAMTGDGVNDAPALREAHIGVAMGSGGTDVARQAADMVIADDNFATIVVAVQEGRAIYRNIQKSIFFLLSSNAGLVASVFVGSFIPKVLPLTPLMILWINLVTNGLPALALGVDPPDPAQMTEPPRKTNTGLLRAREYLGICAVGIWMGAAAIACYLWPWTNPPETALEEARALAFSLLALSPLFHAFNCRSPSQSIFVQKPFLPVALLGSVVLSGAIHLVAVLVPGLRPLFHTYLPESNEWTVMLLLAASIIPAIELLKLGQRAGLAAKSLGPMSRRAPPSVDGGKTSR